MTFVPDPRLQIPSRIHIFGASGSGTTTLASYLSAKHGHRHLDTDDFFWLPTDPPFRQKRVVEERLELLRTAVSKADTWVLSGSLCGWGDPLIPDFQLAIFLHVDPSIRMKRLGARELERYGLKAISPGGKMHGSHVAFLDWAEGYEQGGLETRSRAYHEAWIEKLPCPVIRLESDQELSDQLNKVERLVRFDAS